MKTVFVLNGPNLNLLGSREPSVYGAQTLADVQQLCTQACERLGLALEFRQSNHEGVLIDWLHEAGKVHAAGALAGVVLNAGAYTHTSIALQDCIRSMKCPCVEVHISNVHKREEFRHHSYISCACLGVICGFGLASYDLAIAGILSQKENGE